MYLTDVTSTQSRGDLGLFLESNRDIPEAPDNFEGSEGCGLTIRPKKWLCREGRLYGKEPLPDREDVCRVHGLQRVKSPESLSAASMEKHSLSHCQKREDLPTPLQGPSL